jgi:hypothetical protein
MTRTLFTSLCLATLLLAATAHAGGPARRLVPASVVSAAKAAFARNAKRIGAPHSGTLEIQETSIGVFQARMVDGKRANTLVEPLVLARDGTIRPLRSNSVVRGELRRPWPTKRNDDPTRIQLPPPDSEIQ